jgi:hypothetical protein
VRQIPTIRYEGERLFVLVTAWRTMPPRGELGWNEVQPREWQGSKFFHCYAREDGSLSFRRPGDDQSYEARIGGWEVRT